MKDSYIYDPALSRCGWNSGEGILTRYHDVEWGFPQHHDRFLFEAIVLDGMQAGLSWMTILNKRENFRAAFDGFDINQVADYSDAKVEELLQNSGIIRNRAKIRAAIGNARVTRQVQQEFGSLDAYLWHFTDGETICNRWESLDQIPARTELSDRVSKDMIRRGYKFCGSTIVYAFLQGIGVVNDHITSCFRHAELTRLCQ